LSVLFHNVAAQYNITYSYDNVIAVGPNGNFGYNVTFTINGNAAGPNGIPSNVNTKPFTWKNSNVMIGDAGYHIIYYGAGGYFNDVRRNILEDVLFYLHESSWYLVAKKYGVGKIAPGNILNLDCTTTTYGCYLNQNEIPRLLGDLIYNNQIRKDSFGEYVVVLGKDTIEEVNTGKRIGRDYCAYHSHFTAASINRPVDSENFKYAVVQVPNRDAVTLPSSVAKEVGYTSKPASGCFINRNKYASPNGDPEMDQLIPLVLHELTEIMISPTARNNYNDEDLNEAMDKCVPWYQGVQTSSDGTYEWNAQVQGRRYLLPSNWDPELQACNVGTDPSGTYSKSWVKMGCYTDGPSRALSYSVKLLNIHLGSCMGLCASKGFRYAAGQNGDECWCGNSIDNGHAPAPEAECNKKCVGSDQMCGGPFRNSLFRLADWSHLGCYEDGPERTLEGSTYFTRLPLTVELCQQYCASKGYQYAGLEMGNECYCGNSINKGRGLKPASECNAGCVGNPLQKCGGPWRLSLYRTTNMGYNVDGYVTVRPLHKTNYCIDQPAGTLSNFVQLQATFCEAGNKNQRLVYDRTTQQIKVTNNGVKCLDVYAFGSTDGSKVSIYDCNSEQNQKFLFNAADRSFRPMHAPNMCLDVPPTGGGGELLRIWTCNGAANQQFNFHPF